MHIPKSKVVVQIPKTFILLFAAATALCITSALPQLRLNRQQPPDCDLLATKTGGTNKIWTKCCLNTEQSVWFSCVS